MQPGQSLAIVTQDPTNYGGVLRLVEYLYRRAVAGGIEPTLVHYARFSVHPELNASSLNLLRVELNLWPRFVRYDFQDMRAIAIGACLPEWEPNRIRTNHLWKRVLNLFDGFILVTGSAHTGLPLVQCNRPFVAWVSSTVESDRRERLKHQAGIAALSERFGLSRVKKAEQLVLNHASRVLAVSNNARDEVSQLSSKPVEVATFPIDTDLFAPQPGALSNEIPVQSTSHSNDTSAATFLFVGRANDPRKRIDLFFDSCDKLRTAHPALSFRAQVISQIRPSSLGRTFEVEYIPLVSREELIGLYRQATALVLTSEQEGLGIAAMEAMACGLPVISTRCGGPETFIEDNISGFLVTDDANMIARTMATVATDSLLRARISEASRKAILNNFSEHVWNPRFDELIQNLP